MGTVRTQWEKVICSCVCKILAQENIVEAGIKIICISLYLLLPAPKMFSDKDNCDSLRSRNIFFFLLTILGATRNCHYGKRSLGVNKSFCCCCSSPLLVPSPGLFSAIRPVVALPCFVTAEVNGAHAHLLTMATIRKEPTFLSNPGQATLNPLDGTGL